MSDNDAILDDDFEAEVEESEEEAVEEVDVPVETIRRGNYGETHHSVVRLPSGQITNK